jgi:ribosomal protein S18 acetylase RimI-like enzyme
VYRSKVKIEIVKADYHDPQHGRDIVFLLNSYAEDPMGGGEPLAPAVKKNLVATLAELQQAFTLLCYVDGQAAGIANCLEGFSTFSCRKLLNIHDIAVLEQFRGLGLGQRLLAGVEEAARERDCCKITLEVLEGNKGAAAAYRKFGFDPYELDPKLGRAMFWEKKLA